MKFVADRITMKSAMDIALRVSPTRAIVQSTLLTKITADPAGYVLIQATDLRLSATILVGAKVEEPGSVALATETIHGIVSNMQENTISFSTGTTGAVNVSSGKQRSRLNTSNADDFPIVERYGEGGIEIDGTMFAQMAGLAAMSAAKDNARVILNGILVEFNGNDAVMAGADAVRLSVCYARGITTSQDTKKVVIPLSTTAELIKSLDGFDRVKMNITDNGRVMFKADGIELTSQAIEGEFPNYNIAVRKSHKTTAIVDRRELKSALALARNTVDELMPHASIEIDDESLTVRVSSSALGDTVAPIESETTGPPMSVGVNIPNLVEAMTKMRSERIRIGLLSSEAPIVITEEGRDDFIFIIMPSVITFKKKEPA